MNKAVRRKRKSKAPVIADRKRRRVLVRDDDGLRIMDAHDRCIERCRTQPMAGRWIGWTNAPMASTG